MNGAETPVEPLSWWVGVICFGIWAIAFYGHFSFRKKGRFADTWMRRNYFNEYLTPWFRYAPLNLLPVAIVFALWGGIVVMSHLPDNGITDYIVVILLISSLISFAIHVKRHLSGYPDEMKPQWLIDEEHKHYASERDTSRRR